MALKSERFCADCGARLSRQWIAKEQRYRSMCMRCGQIAYQNPRILVTTIVNWGEKVLLCQRADSPARGRWNPPSGFVECGETLEDAAVREIREETHVHINADELHLYALSTLLEIGEIYVSFRAVVEDSYVACGDECLDVQYFSEEELPWQDLAYPEMIDFYRLFFREKRTGAFSIHLTHLDATHIGRSSYRVAEIERVQGLQGLVIRRD